MLLTPLYLDIQDLKDYFLNKIDFGNDTTLQQVTDPVLSSWTRQGEVEVEKDLRPFYQTPFQTSTGENWVDLPATTHDMLWNLLMTSAQIFIMKQQFGRKVNSTGEDAITYLKQEYQGYLNFFYTRTPGGTYLFGQAENLLINPTANVSSSALLPVKFVNNCCSPQMEYAIRRINNPSRTWYNAFWYNNGRYR